MEGLDETAVRLQYVTGIQDAMGFVAVFFGSLEIMNAGTYTFCLNSHDGCDYHIATVLPFPG